MENRKPFELRKVLIVYNAAQVIFSAWLFYEVINDYKLNKFPRIVINPVFCIYSPA